MKLIVGLGNPGKEYKNTRHNIGFDVLEHLAEKLGLPNFKMEKKFNAETSSSALPSGKVVLVKPQTFMNNSGSSVRAIMEFYKMTPADLIVIHDDKDIVMGETKFQNNRGSAGHNGVKSIIEHLGTQDFTRVRVGIAAADSPIQDTADFVLSKFSKDEKKSLDKSTEEIIKEITKKLE